MCKAIGMDINIVYEMRRILKSKKLYNLWECKIAVKNKKLKIKYYRKLKYSEKYGETVEITINQIISKSILLFNYSSKKFIKKTWKL